MADSQPNWDAGRVQAQLRLTANALGKLQDKKDSLGQITRKDIAKLLEHGNIVLARAKAQILLREDAAANLLEVLEMHIGVVLEHHNELLQSVAPTPVMIEATASIIYAAPRTECNDLHIVKDMLIERLGPDFARSAVGNCDGYVSQHVMQAVAALDDHNARIIDCLSEIARAHGIIWVPPLRPEEKLNAISALLDRSATPDVVHLPTLRQLCSGGIPEGRAWLRPRVWKLLLGIAPVAKCSWESEFRKQREGYYELIDRLLGPLSRYPAPTYPLTAADRLVLNVFKALLRAPQPLFSWLREGPQARGLCPLDELAAEGIRMTSAVNLDSRLQTIQETLTAKNLPESTPKIRLEGVEEEDASASDSLASGRQAAPTTLHPSQLLTSEAVHPKHWTSLLRLLYVHASLHPGIQSPHIVSLLVSLYSVLVQEIESEDLAHAEADTFWLFEAIVGEFAELEEGEGGNLWMHKFGQRLKWADGELYEDLHMKGLDPGLPHYSYRWLAPLLTHTLPLASALLVWDAMFALPERTRNFNPKLEYLVDICTSMLIRARMPLFRLGKPGRRSPSLWNEENVTLPPPSPSRAWELGDAFMEGMSLLQSYPIVEAGGVGQILQTASDLARRREEVSKLPKLENLGLGARLRASVWQGLTNQSHSSDDSSDEETEDGTEEEQSSANGDAMEPIPTRASGFASMLRTTVWRGITNESAMEPPPTPLSPGPSPEPPKTQFERVSALSKFQSPSLWSYAEKLGETDTAATLSKVSTNWRVKAIEAWNSRKFNTATDTSSTTSTPTSPQTEIGHNYRVSLPLDHHRRLEDEARRGSLPDIDRFGFYSPPARPAFFRPPRDSLTPLPRGTLSPSVSSHICPDSDSPAQSDSSLLSRTKNIQASLASLTGLQSPPKPTAKSGPRPLFLNSSSLITSSHGHSISHSSSNMPSSSHERHRSDAARPREQLPRHHDAKSSLSSLSSVDAFGRSRRMENASDGDSDARLSRIIPLGRRAVSPMAPKFKDYGGRPPSATSSVTSSERSLLSPPMAPEHLPREPREFVVERLDRDGNRTVNGWRIDVPDSPATVTSSSPPRTPTALTSTLDGIVRVSNPEHQRLGSVVLSEHGETYIDSTPQVKKLARKKTPPLSSTPLDYVPGSPPATLPARSPRLRSKRHTAPRPAVLQLRESSSHSVTVIDQMTPSPSAQMLEPVQEHGFSSITPKAAHFSLAPLSPELPNLPPRLRNLSTEGLESRPRKCLANGKDIRDSGSSAEDGDDEGYDELLTAYESDEEKRIFDS